MTLRDLQDAVITDGMAAVRGDYATDPDKRKGSMAGFLACRGLDVDGLKRLLEYARSCRDEACRRVQAREMRAGEYWEASRFEAEVEYVANCVSVVLSRQGRPTIVPPTVRAAMQVARILGVRPEQKEG